MTTTAVAEPTVATELPPALPDHTVTGPVVVVTGRRDQSRSRWIPTLSTVWSQPDALDRPVVVVDPTQLLTRTDATLTVLAGLGKDSHVTGAAFRELTDDDVPAAWLLTRRTREIIVRDANTAKPSTLRALVELAVGVGARIWLIAHHHREDELDDIAELWAAHRTDLDTFDTWWCRPDRTPARRHRKVTPLVTCDLPASSALTFRADCRRLLTPDRFAEVDALYVTEFHAANTDFADRDQLQHSAVETRLRARIRTQREPWQVLTVARAIEAAALWHGFDVDIDHHLLLNAAEQLPRPGRLNRSDHAALDAYSRPSWCAVLALAALEVPLNDILTVPFRALTEDGATVTIDRAVIDVPATLRPYLAAQHLVRTFQGAGPDDPAFITRAGVPGKTQWVSRIVRVAEVELGIRLVQSRRNRRRLTATEWTQTHGIAVRTVFDGATRRRKRP